MEHKHDIDDDVYVNIKFGYLWPSSLRCLCDFGKSHEFDHAVGNICDRSVQAWIDWSLPGWGRWPWIESTHSTKRRYNLRTFSKQISPWLSSTSLIQPAITSPAFYQPRFLSCPIQPAKHSEWKEKRINEFSRNNMYRTTIKSTLKENFFKLKLCLW